MPDLERSLSELSGVIEFPATPDLAPAVRRRIADASVRRRLAGRRALVLAFAVVLVAVGAVMAVPQARTAILEWLGLRGVSIERVETAPTAPGSGASLALGERVTLDEAEERAGFDVLVPEELGEPDEVYAARLATADVASLLWQEDGEVEALLTELEAGVHEEFVINKAAGPGTTVATLDVDGGRGFWLEGDPHLVAYVDPRGGVVEDTVRLAGNVLLWERGDVTLRLEGDFGREEALEIARSIG
jgi:hypothetical protein